MHQSRASNLKWPFGPTHSCGLEPLTLECLVSFVLSSPGSPIKSHKAVALMALPVGGGLHLDHLSRPCDAAHPRVEAAELLHTLIRVLGIYTFALWQFSLELPFGPTPSGDFVTCFVTLTYTLHYYLYLWGVRFFRSCYPFRFRLCSQFGGVVPPDSCTYSYTLQYYL